MGELVKGDDGVNRYTGLRIHDLRHTAVTFWIAAGASPKEVATWAGHSSVATVLDRYGHLLPGQEDRVTDVLGAMFSTATATPSAPVLRVIGDRTVGLVWGWGRFGVPGLAPDVHETPAVAGVS